MRTFIILLFITCLFSCQEKNEPVPDNILPPAKMQEVLWDMFRADLHLREIPSDSLREIRSFSMYSRIMDIHKTTQSEFRESFNYYRAHPDQFKIILDSVEKKGSRQIVEPIQTIPDSIRKPRFFKKTDTLSAQ